MMGVLNSAPRGQALPAVCSKKAGGTSACGGFLTTGKVLAIARRETMGNAGNHQGFRVLGACLAARPCRQSARRKRAA